MGQNSTEVAYGFGQFGSTFLEGDGKFLDLTSSSAKYYVCAITMLTDVRFGGSGLGILDAGVELGMGNTHFASNEDTQTLDDDWGATTNETDNDSDLIVLDAAGTVFPAGVTIYGRFTSVEIGNGKTGALIAYIGE